MRLESEFIRLPLQFDAQALRSDLERLPADAWRGHPQGFAGNTAVPLISRDGDPGDDRTTGVMRPTQWLERLPYLRAVLGSLDAPLGRARLMRIEREAQVPGHVDLDYYWQSRLRVHVPILTDPSIQFECGPASVHMAAGQAWVFDTTRLHRVTNPDNHLRVHLVADSVGSSGLLALLDKGLSVDQSWPVTDVAMGHAPLRCESFNQPDLMSPHELRALLGELTQMVTLELGEKHVAQLQACWLPLIRDWAAAWAEFGPDPYNPAFGHLQGRLEQAAASATGDIQGTPLRDWLRRWLVEPALLAKGISATAGSVGMAAGASQFAELAPIGGGTESAEPSYASEYTDSLPQLLQFLGGSLAVTTYASDRVVLLRAGQGELNTHFKRYAAPMGLAFNGSVAALGAARSVWLFREQSELGQALQPAADRVYNPVSCHITGDIRVHELAWGEEGLWVVNTRFSCLANLDAQHSFVPRWHPRFVTSLKAEDACHLNGLAMRDGQPSWVSALGTSSEPGGWRAHKLTGGVVIDVNSSEIVASGLCMPHSPRWHAGALWVLDSGRGELSRVDLDSGRRESVVRLPGFARGLAMIDRYAFVGCSRVRESAWFGGLPILDRERPPECGIWAVDLESGEVIGWLRFEEGIDEIFDVQWLPQTRWPDLLESDEETAYNGFYIPAQVGGAFS